VERKEVGRYMGNREEVKSGPVSNSEVNDEEEEEEEDVDEEEETEDG